MMFEEGEEEGDYYWFSSIESSKKKKKKMMNKKRFSDEQVRSLESIFENETKLEPKKKMLLAQELGLQPRQVAIWFQNKRARYKSKQLERDYAILRANYNALASKFDSLNKDNQSLLLQVQKLRDMIGDEKKEYKKEEEGKKNSNNNDDESDKPSELSVEGGSMLSDDDGSSETDVLNMVHPVPPDSFTATKPTWMDDLRPDGLFDQAVDSSQWWDFWS